MRKLKNKLQVWHFAQVPCEPFRVDVKDEIEAKKIMDTLAQQHLFLYKNNIIPDYSNCISVEMLDVDDEWVDYYNEEEMMDWEEFEKEYLESK